MRRCNRFLNRLHPISGARRASDAAHDPRRRPAGRRLHRHRLPGDARVRRTSAPTPATGCWPPPTDARVHPQPARPPARRAPARRQRHRLPRPVRPLLRRGRPGLRGRGRRAAPLRADPLHPRPRATPRPPSARWPVAATGWSSSAAPSATTSSSSSPPAAPRWSWSPGRPIGGVDSVNAENHASAVALAEHLLDRGRPPPALRRRPGRLPRRRRALGRGPGGRRPIRARRRHPSWSPSTTSTRTPARAVADDALERRRPARRLRLRQRRARPRPARPAAAPPASTSPAPSWSPAGTT